MYVCTYTYLSAAIYLVEHGCRRPWGPTCVCQRGEGEFCGGGAKETTWVRQNASEQDVWVCIECVFVCACVCVCVCMCVYVSGYIYILIYIYSCIYTCIYVIIYICIYIYIQMHTYLFIYINIHIYICIYIYMYTYIHMYIYIYIYVCMYMYVYVYTYIFIIQMIVRSLCVWRCMCTATHNYSTKDLTKVLCERSTYVKHMKLSYYSHADKEWKQQWSHFPSKIGNSIPNSYTDTKKLSTPLIHASI